MDSGSAPSGASRNDGVSLARIYRPYCGGATGATPPVGTVASAVLVDLADAACDFSALAVSLAKRSCTGLVTTSATGTLGLSNCGSTSATASVVTRLVRRNSARDNSCR